MYRGKRRRHNFILDLKAAERERDINPRINRRTRAQPTQLLQIPKSAFRFSSYNQAALVHIWFPYLPVPTLCSRTRVGAGKLISTPAGFSRFLSTRALLNSPALKVSWYDTAIYRARALNVVCVRLVVVLQAARYTVISPPQLRRYAASRRW